MILFHDSATPVYVYGTYMYYERLHEYLQEKSVGVSSKKSLYITQKFFNDQVSKNVTMKNFILVRHYCLPPPSPKCVFDNKKGMR